MENASKALIIAGAILLAIVLVSLGVLVINNARKDLNDKNMDEASIQAFNKNITQYCGKNKSGTEMNSLMAAVMSSNGAQKNKAEQHYISYDLSELESGSIQDDNLRKKITINNASKNITMPTFSNSFKYKAEYEIGDDGYINNVIIKKNS